MDKSLCRIGVFYDGSFFTYAQLFFYKNNYGWIDFRAFHRLIEEILRKKEQNFPNHRVVYAGWYQGLFASTQAEERQLRKDRNLHNDLIHAGIEAKYVPMSQNQKEKGVDVALTVDAMEVGLGGKIDIAVLVTGDGDFVPLVRAFMKHGIRVTAAYFEYENGNYKAFANDRLLTACNYTININRLEKDKQYQALFNGLFRKSEGYNNASSLQNEF